MRELRTITVTPHVPRKQKGSAIDERTTTWEGYAIALTRQLTTGLFQWPIRSVSGRPAGEV